MWEIFLELIVMVDAVQERDYNSDALGIVLLEFIFLFFREFQPMASALDKHSLSSDQDINQFQCRRRLNPRSLIQPSETLLVDLTGTYYFLNLYCFIYTVQNFFHWSILAQKLISCWILT